MNGRELKRAVFLDRDGVLNRDSPEFIKTPDELEILPGVPEAVARLNRAGFLTIVITNQSGVARGLITAENLGAIHEKLRRAIAGAGGEVAGIYHCPHMPDGRCDCRKPAPGMLVKAARDHVVDLTQSFLVGDRPEDIGCGSAAGCRTILVLSGTTRNDAIREFVPPPDAVCEALPQAVDWILSEAT